MKKTILVTISVALLITIAGMLGTFVITELKNVTNILDKFNFKHPELFLATISILIIPLIGIAIHLFDTIPLPDSKHLDLRNEIPELHLMYKLKTDDGNILISKVPGVENKDFTFIKIKNADGEYSEIVLTKKEIRQLRTALTDILNRTINLNNFK